MSITKKKSIRHNKNKVEWSQVHFKSIEDLPKVLMFGEKKYSRDNWKIGLNPDEILDSMFRHLTALIDGEILDNESGLPHIGHIMSNCMFWKYHTEIKNNNSE